MINRAVKNKSTLPYIALSILAVVLFVVAFYTVLNTSFFNQSSSKKALVATTVIDENFINSLGEPESSSVRGDTTTNYYPTKADFYKDILATKNGKFFYLTERILDENPGFLIDYTNDYGEIDLLLYDGINEEIMWNIFLEEGLGVGTYIGEPEVVGMILRFQPQTKQAFMSGVVSHLGLLDNPPTQDHEPSLGFELETYNGDSTPEPE